MVSALIDPLVLSSLFLCLFLSPQPTQTSPERMPLSPPAPSLPAAEILISPSHDFQEREENPPADLRCVSRPCFQFPMRTVLPHFYMDSSKLWIPQAHPTVLIRIIKIRKDRRENE
eukprot:TRINITY_DN14001_c0_g3_i3.p2 TRINITY_DN14001_c0_g3~~TRINITY_DN14001_c0_g3_i3.p2  ORF type:complete len:116 (-),score=16.82 TRINITY_DN14001_c0_g3_i3:408-755(-)